jgi:phage-related tail fiber protein
MSVIIGRKGGAGSMSDAEIMAAVRRLDGPGSGLDADTLRGELPTVLAVPAGVVLWFAADAPPAGFLECDGAAISRNAYDALFAVIGEIFGSGDCESTFALPDLRGEFLRGWDNGRGVDAGRVFGTAQGFAMQNIEGAVQTRKVSNDAGMFFGASGPFTVSFDGTTSASDVSLGSSNRDRVVLNFDASKVVDTDVETRSRNVSLLPCIKY